MTVADAHALADRLERDHRSDTALAAQLIRALLRGRAPGDGIDLGSLPDTTPVRRR